MDMKVRIGNLELKNPLILASAGYTSSLPGLKKQLTKGYGAVITKTVTIKPLQGAPSPQVFWYDPEEKKHLSGAEALKNPGIDYILDALDKVKGLAKSNDCKIIGSCTGNTLEDILYICRKYEEVGVDAIELNMVCPSTGPHLGEDYAQLAKWWTNENERSIHLINSVKEAVRIPVWAKIHLEKMVERQYLKAVDENGRPDAYSFVGGRMPNLKIDIEKGKPVLPGNLILRMERKMPISPMVTGPVKPSTILHTAYIAKQTNAPVVCAGGLSKGTDIIEAIMAGAHAAQISAAVYRDPECGPRIVKEMEEAMDKYGYKSFEEIRGIALKHLPEPPLLTVPGAKWC